MSEHRFYVGDGLLASAGPVVEVTLMAEPAHRISRVLHLREGERVALLGDGREFEAVLTEVGKNVRARLEAELPAEEPPGLSLTLYQALIRPNRFEWLIEKGTELGVRQFVPIVTERTTVRATEIGASRQERWRRIAVEATEQCGRHRPPALLPPIDYAKALELAVGTRVLAWEGLRSNTESQPSGVRPPISGHLSLFIGPEGGWSPTEIDTARGAGASFMPLGPTILRAETAAIVAATLLLLG